MDILGKSDTGFGFLFEYDAGYVSPKHNQDFILEMKDRIKKKAFDFKMPTVTGVMQKYGVENKNGRIYPEEILKREVVQYMKLVEMGASAGETDHPETAVISISNVSMRIINLWWEGRTLMGEIYLPITRGFVERGGLYHPADKIAHDIMHGFQYGVSSRGVGSVEASDGKNIVQDDFELICWDFVTTPSTNGSWVSPDKKDLAPYVEGTESSAFENKMKDKSYSQSEKDWFKMAKKKKNASVEDAISKFMRGYK